MRVVFDSLGAPSRSGGMRSHARQIINGWVAAYPDDDVHVVGPRWLEEDIVAEEVTLHRWNNESVLFRAPGQLVVSAVVARRVSADVVISLSPIVTPFSGKPSIAFQHDWRHKKNPSEFSLAQRVYRILWSASARWANFNACISPKAERETLAYAPGSRTVLVPNGFDEARNWARYANSEKVQGQVITFGHHNNKRPELLIEAMVELTRRTDASLVVLGASGSYRGALEKFATDLGVTDSVSFPGFVDQDTYERLVSSSSVIALVSSDEGFGLPIAEAICLGTPAIVTTDSGMDEIFGNYPTVVEPEPIPIASALLAMLDHTTSSVPVDIQTWAGTVEHLRAQAHALVEATLRTHADG